jgi:predicted GIY-YIG superfamily endonuclease
MFKVYLIENEINSKKYVGYTKNPLQKRFYQHTKSQKPIGKAIRLHGKEKFKITLLCECLDKPTALEMEKQFILQYSSYGNGYNCSAGGETAPPIKDNSVYKTKKFVDKVRKNAIEQHSNPTTKQTHIDGIKNFWKNISEDQRKLRAEISIRNGRKSKVAWNKGKKFPNSGLKGEKNPMSKHYAVWYPNDSYEIIFCLKKFCKENGLCYRNAQYVVDGKQRHHKGFRFARLEKS